MSHNHAIKIEFGLAVTSLGMEFLDRATTILANNASSVPQNPGVFVEDKVHASLGASGIEYEIIDDFRGGNATSIKTCRQNLQRTLRVMTQAAEEIGNHKNDFKPGNTAPLGTRPIPITQVSSRSLLFVIPESHSHFFNNPTFRETIRRVAIKTRVMIRVVPLRRWRP